MSPLELRPAASCRWDLVSLGEVMLRLDPGERRIATTRTFDVWEGGGEYNVARGLKRCFGLRTAIVTALVDNSVGRLIEDLIYQGGVERAQLNWTPDDGVGQAARNGLNFTERGFGIRAPLGCSDRGHSAASQMRPGEVDWDVIFGRHGARWFHTGGIFAALSETTAEVAREAMSAARRHGTIVSYDLNYRPSLWKARGASDAAARVNQRLVDLVDVLVGNEEDLSAGLGYALAADDADMLSLNPDAYADLLAQVLDRHPRLAVAASTLRRARTATINDWNAVCRTRTSTYTGPAMDGLEIFDRVGGGDSFASGFFYGLMRSDTDVAWALRCGIAHGALAMTTPGDTSMATLPEVERIIDGRSARIVR